MEKVRVLPIVVTQGIVAILAAGALIVSVAVVTGRVDEIQVSRSKAALASCRLLRRVIVVAGASEPRQHARLLAFLRHTGLADCQLYARRAVRS